MLIHAGEGMDFSRLEVPLRPTREEAIAALDRLLYLLQDFPLTPASRSAMLSAYLTTVLRPVFALAPMHCVSSPTRGLGKTILVQSASIIATGTTTPVITIGGEKVDAEIEAAILGGYHLALIDNITRRLGSDRLCAALSADETAVKLMYNQKHASAPNKTAWFATGNNLLVRNDLQRRVIIARMIAESEFPESRPASTFVIPGGAEGFKQYCRDHRLELLSAVLTIARWGVQLSPRAIAAAIAKIEKAEKYIEAGSFDEWIRYVRLPLIMLKQVDPLKEQREAAESDPDRAEHYEILEAIAKAKGNKAWLSKEVENLPEFKAERGRPNGVGLWLRAHMGKPVHDLLLERVPDKLRHGAVIWYVKRLPHPTLANLPPGTDWKEEMRIMREAEGDLSPENGSGLGSSGS